MNTMKTVAIQLDDQDYERLIYEARRKGVSHDQLAESYVRAHLSTVENLTVEERRRIGLDALNKLAEFRARVSISESVDPVQLIRDGRMDLEERFTP